MRFVAYSHSAVEILERYEEPLDETQEYLRSRVLIRKYAALCPWEVTLITPSEEVFLEEINKQENASTLLSLFEAWRSISGEAGRTKSHLWAWRTIMQLGQAVNPDRPRLRRFAASSEPKFFILYRNLGQFLNETKLLSYMWQLYQGRMPIHAAGVCRDDGLYLFLGRSGAGKSTAASISAQMGYEVLDEDQVLLFLEQDTKFYGGAWRDSLRMCDKPLRGVFNLVQSTENRLTPLSKAHVVHAVLRAYLQIAAVPSTSDIPQEALDLAASLARTVPGYELHFCKSPEFWDVIDAEFADHRR